MVMALTWFGLRFVCQNCVKCTAKVAAPVSYTNVWHANHGFRMFKFTGVQLNSKRTASYRKARIKCERFIEFNESLQTKPSNFSMSAAEWEKLESECINEVPLFAGLMDYSVMKTLKTESRPEMAMSWMAYIKSRRTANLATTAQFIDACGSAYPETVLNEFRELEKSNILSRIDLETIKKIVSGVSQTSEWRKCIDLFRLAIKSYGDKLIPLGSYGLLAMPVLQAAVRNDDFEMYYRLMNNKYCMLQPNHQELLLEQLFIAWQQREISLEVFLELLKMEGAYLSQEQADAVYQHCKSGQWGEVKAKFVIIPRHRGTCNACGDTLPSGELTPTQFQELSEDLVNSVLIGKSVYKNSRPEELQDFLSFLEQNGPFQVVVDGLNVMLNNADKRSKWHKLFDVVNLLKPNERKILVVSRSSVKRCQYFKKVLPLITLYQVENSTADDLFVLLAALHSGEQTYILTNDNLRDHRFLLYYMLQPAFTRWQNSRQIVYSIDTRGQRARYKLQMPACFDAITQDSVHGWHVPYVPQGDVTIWMSANKFNFRQPNSFLCIQKNNYRISNKLQRLREAKTRAVNNMLDLDPQ